MENIIKQLKNEAKHTRLSSAEKAEMKGALLRHVKSNPVGSDVLSAHSIPSPFFNINNFRNKKGISALVIGGLLMSGSVSFAAENTLPGDVLYPVKVSVNERVRGAVAVTPKAKADWDMRLVERRLEEVEKLATNPEIRPEVKRLAEDNLEHYTERVKARIAKFEDDEDSEDAIETASSLSNMLTVHEQVIAGFETEVTPVVAATTTPSIAAQTRDEEPANETLRKVRGARDDAEKKHKELKKKYFIEDEISRGDDVTINTQLPPATASILPGDHEDAMKARIKKVREEKKDKREEIHNAPTVEIETSPVVTATTSPIIVSTSTPSLPEEHKESDKHEDRD